MSCAFVPAMSTSTTRRLAHLLKFATISFTWWRGCNLGCAQIPSEVSKQCRAWQFGAPTNSEAEISNSCNLETLYTSPSQLNFLPFTLTCLTQRIVLKGIVAVDNIKPGRCSAANFDAAAVKPWATSNNRAMHPAADKRCEPRSFFPGKVRSRMFASERSIARKGSIFTLGSDACADARLPSAVSFATVETSTP